MLLTDRLFHSGRPCVYLPRTICFSYILYISNEYINIRVSFRIPHQPFRRRNILAQLRHAGVMCKVHIARLSVTVLRHNHHSQVFRRILAYRFRPDACQRRAIEQHHHIRILLDGAALAQIAQDRTAEGASVATPVQLAQVCATSCSRFRFFWSDFISQSCR